MYHPPRIDPESYAHLLEALAGSSELNPVGDVSYVIATQQAPSNSSKGDLLLGICLCESQKVGNKSLEVEKVGEKTERNDVEVSQVKLSPGPSILAPKNHRSRTVSAQKSMMENAVLPPQMALIDRYDH